MTMFVTFLVAVLSLSHATGEVLPESEYDDHTNVSTVAKINVGSPDRPVYMYGAPYDTDGEYEYALTYNSYPVYQFDDPEGYTDSIYRRSDGKWYLDYTEVSEDWDGTIDFSLEAASNPWEVTWNSGVVLITTSVHMYGAPYDTDGEYQYALTYNSYPVYQFDDPGGYTDSIYRRSDGKWYLDYTEVSEDYDGTIDFSLEAASNPWEVTWNSGVVLITTSVHMYGAPNDTDGEYKYAFTYNSFPVYQFDDPEGYTDSIYRRSDGKWYLDYTEVSEDWDGTIDFTSQEGPYPCAAGTWDTGLVVPTLECMLGS